MRQIIRLYNASHFSHPCHRRSMAHPRIQLIVVPFVPDGPHEDSRVVLDLVHSASHQVRISRVEHRVHYPNASCPESIENRPILDVRVSANCVDASLHHQIGVLLDEATKVVATSASRSWIPRDALQVK